MALIENSQIRYPLSGSFIGSFSGSFIGSLENSKIVSGSISSEVNVVGNLFLIKSASFNFMTITSEETTIRNNIFLVKDSSDKTVFKVSSSIIYLPTQSTILPDYTSLAGSIYFTSSSFYVGLES